MKIVLIGPGIMPIPPTGWGAVEILVWDTKIALEKLGHEVLIINTKNGRQIIDEINNFKVREINGQSRREVRYWTLL